MKFRQLITLSLLAILGFVSCVTQKLAFEQQPKQAISIMAYNVENLFDTQHDENTEDYTFLPLKVKNTMAHKNECAKIRSKHYREECLNVDWNNDVLNRKLERLADSVLQINSGKGPDILMLEEVENMHVLKMWNDQFLKPAQYKSVILIEGFDKRGIDVAMLSRLPLQGKPVLHKIPFVGRTPDDQKWMNRSRGILESHFILPDGKKLVVLGVHFPTTSNPSYWRRQAAEYLTKLMSEFPKDTLVVAGGDFNVSQENESKHGLFHSYFAQNWMVSHLIGCQDCRGTSYYHRNREWSFLDALLFKKNMDPKQGTGSWEVIPQSVSIPNRGKYQTNRFMSPARFNYNSPVGVSDHWPIFALIQPRQNGTPEK